MNQTPDTIQTILLGEASPRADKVTIPFIFNETQKWNIDILSLYIYRRKKK